MEDLLSVRLFCRLCYLVLTTNFLLHMKKLILGKVEQFGAGEMTSQVTVLSVQAREADFDSLEPI